MQQFISSAVLSLLITSATLAEETKLPIDWKAADQDAKASDKATLKTFRSNAPAGVERVGLPVLVLPEAVTNRAAPEFEATELTFTLRYQLDKGQLLLMGTGIAYVAPKSAEGIPQPADASKPCDYANSSDEGEQSADCSFSRYNASYVLRMICDEAADKRCTQPDFLYDAARRVVVVNREGI